MIEIYTMNKLNIALVYGGKSGEHEVSLRSAAAIALHLNESKYTLTLIGVSKTGKWYLQAPLNREEVTASKKLPLIEEEEEKLSILPGEGIFHQDRKLPVDLVFPIVHGTFGEDGRMQGLLEMAEVPYAGAGVLGSAVGMDKDRVKALWERAGLPVVPYLAFRKAHSQAKMQEAVDTWGFPLFIKPTCAGSSVGVSRADNRAQLEQAVTTAFQYDGKVMIEPCVEAREVECSVLGNQDPRVFVPGEIVPQGHTFYDYEAKYLDPDGANLLIPAPLSQAQQDRVQQLARQAYISAECRGFARVDFFLDKKSEEFYLNEINTLPGFTEISMYSMLADASGLPYDQLLDEIIQLGLENFRQERDLTYSL